MSDFLTNSCQNCGDTKNSTCCKSTDSCCTPLGGIQNIDQGYFNNISSKKIVDIPDLDLAYLANCENNSEIDATINLNPTYLNWSDFNLLFFRNPSGSFYINKSNSNVSAIAFNSQTYETTQNKKVSFSLYDQIIKAWAKKNNKSESNIPIPYKIQLERQCFLTKSLISINGYQLGLSLDEVISTLIGKAEIEPADHDSSATVRFNISYKDYFCPLDLGLLVVFTFVTNIPCYRNVSNSDTCPYSKDIKPSRKEFEYDDDTLSQASSYKSYKSKNKDDETIETNHVTEFNLDDDSGDLHNDINKILNDADSLQSKSWN
jgi:hypothetical protein